MQFKQQITNFGLPLLAKELIEQAARKRTYIVRVVYAVLLFFAAFLFFYDILKVGTASPLAMLGSGRQLFEVLVGLQFAGIYFFMPAMTCAVLTHEKERASLQLLFLTRLGPWTILFEKLTSRLIPMFGFLLLSLPLLAFAYTLGGISPAFLAGGIWLLSLAVIQMGTLALACSAWFRTSVGAFIWSYVLTLGMFFGPALGWLIVHLLTGFDIEHIAQNMSQTHLLIFPFFGPAFFMFHQMGGIADGLLIAHSVLVLGSSGLCLVLARAFIVRRAFAPPGNAVLSVFKRLDKIFLWLNDNPITRGKTFVGDTARLPDDEPVAWRETAKRSLGKTQYLLRVFIAIELPVAAVCLMIIFDTYSAEPLSILLVPVGIVSVLMVSAQAASLIAGERSHQTLDVLCTTPLSGRDIVRQKFRSVRRLMLVLLVPFLTIFFFECAMKWNMPGRYGSLHQYGFRGFSLPLYLTCSFLTVGVYLPMFAWLSLYIGLRVNTQARAITGSLAAILAWCVVPLLFVCMPLAIMFRAASPDSGIGYSLLLSPASIIAINEEGQWRSLANLPWFAVAVNFAAYGLITLWLRKLCYSRADRLLGRVPIDKLPETRGASPEFPKSFEIDVCLSEK
jgi:ABC-type transport system involved in multi-copper enzyme maturation permease subunit